MTYKIAFDHENFYNLDLDIFALKKAVGKAMGRAQFKRYWLDNTSLAEYWQDIGATWADVGLNNDSAPDITSWNGPHLVLNEKAFSVLEETLRAYGEFMPITIDSEPHTLFYCMREVGVDDSNSEADIVEEIWMGINSIAFDKSTELTNVIFKTKFDRCRGLYCGDDFKQLCQAHDLKGLIFTTDLVAN